MVLFSIEERPGPVVLADILNILFPDARTVLDSTYGKGVFWKKRERTRVSVVGLDLDPSSRASVRGDFTALPFSDQSFDVVAFDPPYQWDVSKKNPSIMGKRFGSYESEADALNAVMSGTREAWRVARLGIVVKVQNHIHGNRFIPMTDWVRWGFFDEYSDEYVSLYDEVMVKRPGVKVIDPKWREQLSVYRNHATFMIFRKGSQTHKRR